MIQGSISDRAGLQASLLFYPTGFLELNTAVHRALTVNLVMHFFKHLFCICFDLVQRSPTFSHAVFNEDLLHVYRCLGVDSWVSGRDLREGSTV